MRPCWFLLSLLFVQLAGAQSPPPLWQVGWVSPFNRGGEPILVRAAADSGVLVLVENIAIPDSQLAVLRHDADGTLAWAQLHPTLSVKHPDLVVTANGDAVLAAYDAGGLVVRRFDGRSGELRWQRQRALTIDDFLQNRFGPVLAIDGGSGDVLVAVSHQDDFLIARWAADGTPGAEVTVPEAGRIDVPTALLADGQGGFVISGRSMLPPPGIRERYLTVAYNAAGQERWRDLEPGPIGNLFTYSWLAAGPEGSIYVVGGPESGCGTFMFMIWRLQADGQRAWTRSWPQDDCPALSPIGLGVLSDGSAIVVAQEGGGVISDGSAAVVAQGDSDFTMTVVRVGVAGQILWDRRWAGVAVQPGMATPQAMAIADNDHVRVVGFEWVTGSSVRYALAEWTADGGLCVSVADNRLSGHGARVAALADGWAVATPGFIAGGSTPSVVTLRYAAVDTCLVDALFGSGFQPL